MDNLCVTEKKEHRELYFQNPAASFRGKVFWFWNGTLDEAGIAEQIKEMRTAGIGEFFIHAMPQEFRPECFPHGLTGGYVSNHWFEMVACAVKLAQKNSMKIWLYDEGGWPSGLANGKILKQHPELKAKAMIKDGSVFLIIENDCRTDLLNPKTTKLFMDSTHEKYKEYLKDDFGKTIVGIFTDEPFFGCCQPGKQIPWTDDMENLFWEIKRYELKSILPVLLDERQNNFHEDSKSLRAHVDFFDVWTTLIEKSFFIPISNFCTENKLLFSGHLAGDESLENHRNLSGNIFKLLRHMDIPGVDTIWRQIHPAVKRNYFPKIISSVAHLNNKKTTVSESFAVYGYGLSYYEMKWVANFQFVSGITDVALMAIYYSNDDSRIIETCCNIYKPDPRWSFYKVFTDYCSRISYLLRSSQAIASALVYYPIENFQVLKSSIKLEKEFRQLSDFMLKNQISFDYISRINLHDAGCRVENGKLKINTMQYEFIIIPQHTLLCKDVKRKLIALAEQGVQILIINNLFADQDLIGSKIITMEKLKKIILPDIEICNNREKFRCLRLCYGKTHIFFIVNLSNKELTTKIKIPVSGKTTLWDPETGAITMVPVEASNTSMTCRIAIKNANGVFIVVDPAGKPLIDSKPARKEIKTKVILFEKEWQYRFLSELKIFRNGIVEKKYDSTPKPFADLELAPEFSGTIEYSNELFLDDIFPENEYILEFPADGLNIRLLINDHYCGNRIWAPYKFSIANFLIRGCNKICIEVTNSLANQFASKEVVAAMKREKWDNCYFKKVQSFMKDALKSTFKIPSGITVYH